MPLACGSLRVLRATLSLFYCALQIATEVGFEQGLIPFRTKLVDSEGTTYGGPSEVQM